MKNLNKHWSVQFFLAILSIWVVTSCDESDEVTDPPVTNKASKILLADNATLGKILTDGDGVTLYFFSNDVSGESTCLEGCLDVWPIFSGAELEIGTGLLSADFDSIKHTNGLNQITYKGWPLYYYSPDGDGVIEQPDAIAGEGRNSVWFVAKPDYTIMLANAQLIGADEQKYRSDYEIGEGNTPFFVDASGRTLYAFTKDFNGVNNFTESDFSNDGAWPVFSESLSAIPSTISKDDFSSIDVFGKTQLTYKGWPLYYFGQDANRGETKGVSVPSPGIWPIVNTNISIAATAPVAATIKLANNEVLGEIMTDGEGRTLYYFAKDVSGNSNCKGGCLNAWPLFYTQEIVLSGDDLLADDFENLEIEGGQKVTTYKGWPLYYYSPTGDAAIEESGSTAGEGVGNLWYVMKKNYSIMVVKSQLVGSDGKNYLEDYTEGVGETTYFTDNVGRTLYTFVNDTKDDNNFTNEDFSNDGAWPIFNVSIADLPSALKASDFGEIDVFGKRQLTFKGWPVYYFGSDSNRGDNKGASTAWPIVNNNRTEAQ